jgi:hypothetical protein
MNLDLIADRYVAACPHGDVLDLALAHHLEIEHRSDCGSLLIDNTIFTNTFELTATLHAHVALCLAFDCMRAARMERGDDVAERIAARILQRCERRAEAA